MADHTHNSVARFCDVAVVGGGAAGLAAAVQLGRQRRSAIVIDAGQPRNAAATHLHGHLGRDGMSPAELLAARRGEVRSYGGEILSGRVNAVTHGEDGHFRVELAGGNVIIARRVLAATGQVAAVELDDHSRLDADFVAVGPRFVARDAPFRPLGLLAVEHPSGLGQVIDADAVGATSIKGVYAAGNVTDPSAQVLQAAADGSRAGAMISADLADEDLSATASRSANEADWDRRYGGDQVWSGRPNGALVAEMDGARPGRAIDVAAGEGGDAIWLAESGWTVTALDVSARALQRVEAEAARRNVRVRTIHADAAAPDAIEVASYDLVCAMYASIPREPENRAVHHIVDAVAPGGTLLVVGHDLTAMRDAGGTDAGGTHAGGTHAGGTHAGGTDAVGTAAGDAAAGGAVAGDAAAGDAAAGGRAFDPDAYVNLEDFAVVIEDSPDWTIEVHHTRPRPPGAAAGSHHANDVVLRARRISAG